MIAGNIRTLLGSIAFLVLAVTALPAQNIYYSQYLSTPLFTNPADVSRGTARQVNLNYRSQGTGEEDNLVTAALTYAQPFMHRESGRTWGGVGVSIVNEQAGYQGVLRHTGAVAAYAHQVYLNDKMTFGGGLSLGLFSRGIDASRITTSSQFTNGGYDPSAGLGEDLNAASRTYLTLTPGLSWSLLDGAGANKAFLGVSLFNANRPDVSFTGQPDRMATHVLLNGGYRIYQKGLFELMPTFRYIRQRGSSQTNIGAISRFSFGAEGLVKPGSVGLGTWYSVNNAAIVSLKITQPGYFINFSYDVPAIDKTMNRRVTNALEVSLGWRRDLKAKAKSR